MSEQNEVLNKLKNAKDEINDCIELLGTTTENLIVNPMLAQKEKKWISFFICIQSFIPLIFILLVKHFDFTFLESDNLKFWTNEFSFSFCTFFVNNKILFFVYIFYLVLLSLGFLTKKILKSVSKRQDEGGLSLKNINVHTNQSLDFFLTYLIPLLGESPNCLKNLLELFILSIIIIICFYKQRLFFDNIVLVHFMGYKIFDFECAQTGETCIGLSDQDIPTENENFRYQRIIDNVFYIRKI